MGRRQGFIGGDYADPGKFLPEGIDPSELQKCADASFSEGYREMSRVNLQNWAEFKFRDISDKVIKVIANSEGKDHPLAHIDLKAKGWRNRPSWGEAS